MTSRIPMRTLALVTVALLLAGTTIFLGYDLVQSQTAASAAAVQATPSPVTERRVLVAAKPLAVGAFIQPGDLAWRAWPSTGITSTSILEDSRPLKRFEGSVVTASLLPGEPITAARISAPGAKGALAAVTGPGKRAVSVALTPTSGVSGLVMPGDRVDVVLTYALPRPADAASFERRAAETILTDLRVLAVDQRLSGSAVDAPEKEVRNASLEVSTKQSEVLALAADLGKLSLSLRSLQSEEGGADLLDRHSGSTLDYQVGRLLPGLSRRSLPRAVASAPAAAPARGASADFIQFRGSKSSTPGSTQ